MPIGQPAPHFPAEYPTYRIVEVFSRFEVVPIAADEIETAHSYAAGLVKLPIASAVVMDRVHRWSGLGMFKAEEKGLGGVIGLVPLSAAGLTAVLRDDFDATDPAQDHVATLNEQASGMFGWGIAATSHEATKRMVAGADAVTREVIPHLAWFGRTVTSDGERLIMRRLGWEPLPGSKAGTVWKPSLLEQGVLA